MTSVAAQTLHLTHKQRLLERVRRAVVKIGSPALPACGCRASNHPSGDGTRAVLLCSWAIKNSHDAVIGLTGVMRIGDTAISRD